MHLHNLTTSLVVFLALVAFGVITFALARFASHGAFSPTVEDDVMPEEAAPDDAIDEGTTPVHYSVRGPDMPLSSDS